MLYPLAIQMVLKVLNRDQYMCIMNILHIQYTTAYTEIIYDNDCLHKYFHFQSWSKDSLLSGNRV